MNDRGFTRCLMAGLAAFGLVALIIYLLPSCSALANRNAANTALDSVALACVFESQLSDEQALADACAIAHDLIPIVRKLMAQRDAAKKSGVHWSPATDAGHE